MIKASEKFKIGDKVWHKNTKEIFMIDEIDDELIQMPSKGGVLNRLFYADLCIIIPNIGDTVYNNTLKRKGEVIDIFLEHTKEYYQRLINGFGPLLSIQNEQDLWTLILCEIIKKNSVDLCNCPMDKILLAGCQCGGVSRCFIFSRHESTAGRTA